MTLLATRVTPPNLRVERITALLEIDRSIRAPLILNRPINAVGPSRLNLVHHAAAARRAACSADTSAHLVGEGGRAGESRCGGARVDAVSEAVARGCRGPLGAAGPDLAWLEDAAGGHAAGRGDVEGDFGVGGVLGAVEVFEFEELGLEFSGRVAAVAALQRCAGAECCWDGCGVRKGSAEREGGDGCEEVHCRGMLFGVLLKRRGSLKTCVVSCEPS
jgi:hypothetical protein